MIAALDSALGICRFVTNRQDLKYQQVASLRLGDISEGMRDVEVLAVFDYSGRRGISIGVVFTLEQSFDGYWRLLAAQDNRIIVRFVFRSGSLVEATDNIPLCIKDNGTLELVPGETCRLVDCLRRGL